MYDLQPSPLRAQRARILAVTSARRRFVGPPGIAWLLACLLVGCVSAGGGSTSVTNHDEQELLAIQRAVDLTYSSSSFLDASEADPDDFRKPFVPSARLAFVSNGELVEKTVDEYVEIRRKTMQGGEVYSLEEWELWGSTEVFGNLAQRMSVYAVRLNGAPELAERGVMSFQLMKVKGKWQVYSLTWQVESDDLRLPERFLSLVE